jgi:RNA-directed DNA polymerase
MHGTKKSDSSIVPAKPANKAERSAAELVEGSDGTKRKASGRRVGKPQHKRRPAYEEL